MVKATRTRWTNWLAANFPDLTSETRDAVVDLVAGDIDPLAYPVALAYRDRCHRHPRREELALVAIDALLGTCGVEGWWCPSTGRHPYIHGVGVSYCNTGDTYAPTIALVATSGGWGTTRQFRRTSFEALATRYPERG